MKEKTKLLMNPDSLPISSGRRATSRRLLALAVLPILLGASARSALAADELYPARPIKIVVNFAAGGPADLLARMVAGQIQAELKQPAFVENRPGAGGNIGAEAVAKANPDGYTVLIALDSTFSVNPTLYHSMPFQLSDFKPVMLLGSTGQSIGVHPSLGVNSLKELIAKGKEQPIAFSSSGNGGPGHISASMLKLSTGVKVDHIPYKGAPPAAMALLSGEVQAGILATPGMAPHFKKNTIKPLAVTGQSRSALLPSVPTVAELGMPELEFSVNYVAMVPAKTPDAVVDILQKQMTQLLNRPDVSERFRDLDFVPVGLTGQAVTERLVQSRERYAKVIRAAGMKID